MPGAQGDHSAVGGGTLALLAGGSPGRGALLPVARAAAARGGGGARPLPGADAAPPGRPADPRPPQARAGAAHSDGLAPGDVPTP